VHSGRRFTGPLYARSDRESTRAGVRCWKPDQYSHRHFHLADDRADDDEDRLLFAGWCAFATVVGVLVEVPVMLTVSAVCNRTRGWFARPTMGIARSGELATSEVRSLPS